jgi:sulfatase maturation enzyme AslB (radical SAM superfamily)
MTSIKGTFIEYKTAPGLKFFEGDQASKVVPTNSGVNVLYFTNKCNLACTYCYEDLPGRPPQIMTQEDITRTIDQVIAREDPNNQTLFVMFGGEATLEWENVCFAMEYAYSKKQNVHFNLETNGIKFLSDKFLNEVKNNYFYKNHGLLSIDVSFDGVGNGERVFHDGSDSSVSMLKVLTKLAQNKMRWRLRYTVQKDNVNYWYEDVSRLARTFHPERVILTVAWDTMKHIENLHELLETEKNRLRQDWINKQISVPVCELFCDMCNGCDERKEFKTYFTNEGNVTTHRNYENAPKFKDFKEKG